MAIIISFIVIFATNLAKILHDRSFSLNYARQIRQSDFDDFDLLLVMDKANYKAVTALAPTGEARAKVRMLTDYLVEHSGTDVVPDPYYGDLSDFDYALDLIEDACEGLLGEISGNY